MDSIKVTAIVLFVLTYISLLAFPKLRAYIALASAFVFVSLGILPAEKVISTVDWNVIMMIYSGMAATSLIKKGWLRGVSQPVFIIDRFI